MRTRNQISTFPDTRSSCSVSFFLILDLFGNRCSSSSERPSSKGELSFPSLQHLIYMKNNLTDAKVDDVSVSKEGREKSPEKRIRGIR